MISDVVLVVFCALVALCGLAVVVWEGVTGRLFSLDGLALTLISLTLAVVFAGNVVWSARTGELQQILGELRKGRKKPEASDNIPRRAFRDLMARCLVERGAGRARS